MNTKNKTICFVAGRSGGHLIPALTLARDYKHNSIKNNILFFSTNTDLEKRIVHGSKVVDRHIALVVDSTPTRWYKVPLFVWQMLRAWGKSMCIFYKQRPAVAIATGGYISIPVCLAAWMLRIPVELWELNAAAGRAAKFLAFCASKIHICFEHCKNLLTHQKKVTLSPYPIRFLAPFQSQERAYAKLNLDATKKVIVILGGSQGSVYLNNVMKQWIESDQLNLTDVQIIHQTGSIDAFDWSAFYQSKGINAYVCAFTDDVEPLYIAADVIICRAGAGTLFEIAFFNKKALIIPLEIETTDHQVDNAYAVAQQYPQLFTVMRQQDIQKNADLFYEYFNRNL
jgi:UDP-N-acetylglucosamine--N-acetylmuramyl-(pentapeptide) pyrophosphoryl-undecaprenol N-acetylglucosamine transferase